MTSRALNQELKDKLASHKKWLEEQIGSKEPGAGNNKYH